MDNALLRMYFSDGSSASSGFASGGVYDEHNLTLTADPTGGAGSDEAVPEASTLALLLFGLVGLGLLGFRRQPGAAT